MKVVNIIFAVLFLLAAILQYNDPDPFLWIPIYLFAAACCALAAYHKFYPGAYIAGIVVFAIYAGYLFFTKDGVYDWLTQYQADDIAASMKATRPWIEQSREFFGLLIIIVALLMNYYFSRRNRKVISV